MRRLLLMMLVAASWSVAAAQSSDGPLAELYSLIEVPKISARADNQLKTHIYDLNAALVRSGYRASTIDNGRVIKISIPCSELFLPNSTVLTSGRGLDIFRRVIEIPKMYRVIVAVSTDNTGDDDYRLNLSNDRAIAVVDYLATLATSVHHPNITAIGLSDMMPVGANTNMAERDANRRVDIYIVPEETMIEMAVAGTLKQ